MVYYYFKITYFMIDDIKINSIGYIDVLSKIFKIYNIHIYIIYTYDIIIQIWIGYISVNLNQSLGLNMIEQVLKVDFKFSSCMTSLAKL